MHVKTDKHAGFWIRFLTRSIDTIIAASLIFSCSLIWIDFRNVKFINVVSFYLWCINIILILLIIWIIIPWIFKGRTIGALITKTKIKIINKEISLIKSLILREYIISIAWIINVLLIMTIVNHTLIINYLTSKSDTSLSSIDILRISVVSIIGGLIVFIQLLNVIFLIVSKNNKSLADYHSKSIIVMNNIYLKHNKKTLVLPKKIKNIEIQWIKNEEICATKRS